MLRKNEGDEMTLYDAIFVRKSEHNFKMEALAPTYIEEVLQFYQTVQNLFLGIETEVSIIENLGHSKKAGHFSVKAPYYMAIYSEEVERDMMNAGYIMEQITLFLTTKGIASCFVETFLIKQPYRLKGTKKLLILLAFGKSKSAATRKAADMKRLPMESLCVFKETPRQGVRQLLEAARCAPSSWNHQLWRFLVFDSRIHVFSRTAGRGAHNKYAEFSFGGMLSHIMVAADELWIDLDMIRLENISHRTFRKSEYVLSIVLNM
ncbi:MAG: nitroreductase family protein [Lachnospiraceae bacterium]